MEIQALEQEALSITLTRLDLTRLNSSSTLWVAEKV